MISRRPFHRAQFEIAIFCALPTEADAVRALFDNCWDDNGPSFGKADGDINAYSTGSIGRHNVVLVHMPGIGKGHAALASQCRLSFTGVKLAIVAGTCGAVPLTPEDREIVLGDVIIGTGIVELDRGRQLTERFVRSNAIWDMMGRPSVEVRGILRKLEGMHPRKKMQRKLAQYLEVLRDEPKLEAGYPGAVHDRLFDPTNHHRVQGKSCEECGCDGDMVRRRFSQRQLQPLIHLGLLGSSDIMMQSGKHRDSIAKREGILGFEMEAAGIWDSFPCVIIKGVSNYADSHKSKMWKRYAAATSAACIKAFLDEWEPTSSLFQELLPISLAYTQVPEQQAAAREQNIILDPVSLSILSSQIEHLQQGLAQAAAFIQETSISLDKHVQLLQQHKEAHQAYILDKNVEEDLPEQELAPGFSNADDDKSESLNLGRDGHE